MPAITPPEATMAGMTASMILNQKFTVTKFREGYDMSEVDSFLDELGMVAETREPAELEAMLRAIPAKRFQVTKFQNGYDMIEVDEFLDAVEAGFTERLRELHTGATTGTGTLGASGSEPFSQPARVPLSVADLHEPKFTVTKFREGYKKQDVDDFLEELRRSVARATAIELQSIPDRILNAQFKVVGFFKEGYDMLEVDDFLDAIGTKARNSR